MGNEKRELKEYEQYLRRELNARLLFEFGIPIHAEDGILWVETIKVIILPE